MDGVGRLDTAHYLSNFRVDIDGDKARLVCYVIAQHFKPGKGSRGLKEGDPGRKGLVLGNRWKVELVSVEGEEVEWRFKRMVVENVWANGSMEVLGHGSGNDGGIGSRQEDGGSIEWDPF